MSEPWKDYAPAAPQAAQDGPWNDYAPPAARKGDARPKSLSLGFMEGIQRPLENFDKINPVNVFQPDVLRRYSAKVDDARHAYLAKREETERPAATGEMAGNIFATAPIALITRNPAAFGAAQGGLLTDKDNPLGVAADMTGGALLNHFGGKVMDAAADFVKPVIEPAVRRLTDAGVKLTPGRIKGGKAIDREDKMTSRPIVGDAVVAGLQRTQDTFNTAAVNKALEPLGAKVPTPIKPGHDSIAYAKRQISDAYDLVIPHLSVNLDGQQFAQSVAPKAAVLQPAQRKEFQRLLTLNLGKGQLHGQALKDAQESLRKLGADYIRTDDPAKRHLGEALFAADDELTSAMLAQNPQWAPQLSKVNQAYKGYRVVADAASRADEGVINTGQLKQAVRRGDRSKNKDATARGEAYLQGFSEDARAVIPARVPDSGTAGRNMAGNIFAYGKGGLESLGYGADNIYQQFRLAPRPALAEPTSKVLKRLKAPATAALIASTQGNRD